jgi:hypothetical protein
MDALLKGLRFYEKRMTACQISLVACPEKSKAKPEGTESTVWIPLKKVQTKERP